MPSRLLAALAGVLGLAPAAVGLTGCGGHTTSAPVTSADRAACTQLGAAYARFNAEPTALDSAIVYLHAINIAGRADNHQLGTAIVSWVTAMRGATGTAAPGAPYATQECQRIGIALRFHPPGGGPNAGTSPVSGAPIAKPDGSDSSGSEGGGND